MARLTIRQFLIAAAIIFCFVGFARGDESPAMKKSDDAERKYELALQRASDAFEKSLVASDRQAVDDLKVALKIARGPEAKTIADDLAAAEAVLANDQARVVGHALVRIEDSPWMVTAKPPAATTLVRGMSKKDARTAFESKAKSMGCEVQDGETTTDADGNQRCQWLILMLPGDPAKTYTVWFNKNEKLTDFTIVDRGQE